MNKSLLPLLLVFLTIFLVGGVQAVDCNADLNGTKGYGSSTQCEIHNSLTFNGTYNMNLNMSGSNYVMVVHTDNITVDCNNSHIYGNNTVGKGINIVNHKNVTIKNCEFSNYVVDLNGLDTEYIYLYNNSFLINGSSYNIILGGNNLFVENNTVISGYTAGIYLYGNVINASIKNNNLSMISSSSNALRSNDANFHYNVNYFNNTIIGISEYVYMYDSTWINNSFGSLSNYITVPSGIGGGILLRGGSNNLFYGNSFYIHNISVIQLIAQYTDSFNNTIDNNKIYGNIDLNKYGIMVGEDAYGTYNNKSYNNTITNNLLVFPQGLSGRHGILVGHDSYSYVYNNTIIGGAYSLVDKENFFVRFINNTCINNSINNLIEKASSNSLHQNNYFYQYNSSARHYVEVNWNSATGNYSKNSTWIDNYYLGVDLSSNITFFIDSNSSVNSYEKTMKYTYGGGNNNLSLFSLTSALIYNTNGSIQCGGLVTGNCNITLPPNNASYVLDNFNLTEGVSRENSPLGFGSSSNEVKHITNSLQDSITSNIIFNVASCDQTGKITYTTDSGIKTIYQKGDYDCSNNQASLTLVVEPSMSSNILEIEYGCDSMAKSGFFILILFIGLAIPFSIFVIVHNKGWENLEVGDFVWMLIVISIGTVVYLNAGQILGGTCGVIS